MKFRNNKIALIALALVFLFNLTSFAENVPVVPVYTCIKAAGTVADMKSQLSSSDKLIKSSDGKTAYIIRRIPIRNEAQLLELMGASNESGLSDSQRGLYETYKFSKSGKVNKLKARVPNSTLKITLELADISGYEDTAKYPSVRRDFWPINRTSFVYDNGDYKQDITIRISGVNSVGMGSRTAERMKGTFAHEFGHSMDFTQIESNGYGHDNSHYVNEKIGDKASFTEGFANFIRLLFFPEEESLFRNAVQTIVVEKPEGGYDEYSINGSEITGANLLHVEAINSLIFNSLYNHLPDGDKNILDSFEKHNSADNDMSKYLQNLIADYPVYGKRIAEILDNETFGKLSDKEMIEILGDSSGVRTYVTSRSGPEKNISTKTQPAKPAHNKPPISRPGQIYKWVDADGHMHFTDTPPPGDIDYTTMDSQPVTDDDAVLDKASNNPFVFH